MVGSYIRGNTLCSLRHDGYALVKFIGFPFLTHSPNIFICLNSELSSVLFPDTLLGVSLYIPEFLTACMLMISKLTSSVLFLPFSVSYSPLQSRHAPVASAGNLLRAGFFPFSILQSLSQLVSPPSNCSA